MIKLSKQLKFNTDSSLGFNIIKSDNFLRFREQNNHEKYIEIKDDGRIFFNDNRIFYTCNDCVACTKCDNCQECDACNTCTNCFSCHDKCYNCNACVLKCLMSIKTTKSAIN